MKKEIADDDDEILIIVNEIKLWNKEDRYNNDSIKGLQKDFPDQNEKLEEALNNFVSESNLRFLKTECPDKWKYLKKKLADPYEFFNSIDDLEKRANKLM